MKKQSETLIIVNLTAGDGLAKNRWQNFQQELEANHIPYKAEITEYQSHAAELAGQAVKDGFTRIGVFSGDGTLNEVIQGIFHKNQLRNPDLKLIFFPAGSSCDFEKKFKQNSDWLKRIQAEDTTAIDIFRIDCKDFQGNPISRYIVNNSSIGLISLANEKFNSVKGLTKKIKQISVDVGAIFCGLQAIVKFQPFQAEMKLDDEILSSQKLSNITTFKTSFFGGDMSYGLDNDQSDGLLNVVWLDGSSKLRLAGMIPSLFSGTVLRKKQAHHHICKQFELNTSDFVIVETDGENIGVPPVKYTILPKALNVIVN